jgi:Flp pilus assembly protein TadG
MALSPDDRGQSLVELALTLPVLLLLAALIVTLSLAGVARLAVENAASEAARTIALTNDDDRAVATAQAAAAPLRAEQLQVRIDPRGPAGRPRGALVRVSVAYAVPLPLAFAGLDAVRVEGAAARRMEYLDAP